MDKDTFETIKSEIENIKFNLEYAEDKIKDLESDNLKFDERIIDLECRESGRQHAYFNIKQGSEGYQNIFSSSGSFLIMLKDALPYLSGYKLIFTIGNPSSATYNDITLNIKWNRSYESYRNDSEFKNKMDQYEKEYSDYRTTHKGDCTVFSKAKLPSKPTRPLWLEECKVKKFSTLKSLKPASWNQIEVHLTPATIEELEWIEVSIETPTVSLLREKTDNN